MGRKLPFPQLLNSLIPDFSEPHQHPYGHMGVSLDNGTPPNIPKHPKMIILSRKTHGCWVPPF